MLLIKKIWNKPNTRIDFNFKVVFNNVRRFKFMKQITQMCDSKIKTYMHPEYDGGLGD